MTVIDLRPKKRRCGRCATCLWHWPELFGGDGFRCYCRESEHYHDEFEKGCHLHEMKLPTSMMKINWGEPREHHKKSASGYGKPTE